MPISTIEEAFEDLKKGKMVIVVDDEDRENEGDLVLPAEKVTPEAINFMAKYGRGLICLAITRRNSSEAKPNPSTKKRYGPLRHSFHCIHRRKAWSNNRYICL